MQRIAGLRPYQPAGYTGDAEILHRAIPHAEMHPLRGAGHVTCWERPAEFNTILLGFLTRQV